MMTAGPWRLDALEILQVTRMAHFDRRHLIDVVTEIVERAGRDRPTREDEAGDASRTDPATRVEAAPAPRPLDELNPLTCREGPHTILEQWLERTGIVLDLIAPTRSRRSGRSPTSQLPALRGRLAAGQPERDAGRLRRLPRCLPGGRRGAADERRADRGRRGRPADDPVPGEGPRVPDRLRPAAARRRVADARGLERLFPPELLREAVPRANIHTEEERRLLYVAMTRAQER